MPINQAVLEMLVCVANPINMAGRKTWVLDGGNFQTACYWFKKITGKEFNLLAQVKDPATGTPASTSTPEMRVSNDGFLFMTVNDDPTGATITLRGGSSTTLDGAWVSPDNVAGRNPHTSVPTLEIQNAERLADVDSFTPFRGARKIIAEIKFTTRAVQSTVTIK